MPCRLPVHATLRDGPVEPGALWAPLVWATHRTAFASSETLPARGPRVAHMLRGQDGEGVGLGAPDHAVGASPQVGPLPGRLLRGHGFLVPGPAAPF